MIRFILRSIGFLLIVAAFAALVVDGTRSIAGGRLLLHSFGETAGWLGGARYAALLAAGANLPAPVRPLVAGALALPAWSVAGVLGLLLLYAGRPPAPVSGFSSRRS